MPFIHSVTTKNPKHKHSQGEIFTYLKKLLDAKKVSYEEDRLKAFFDHSGVETRYLSMPLTEFQNLTDLKSRNDIYIKVATDLVAEAINELLHKADLSPEKISMVMSTTITGIATPSIDARVMNKITINHHAKRIPLFGLGCLGGVAGINRACDYLKAYPKEAAIFFSVELCSLTLQLDDLATSNLISMGLFGDGAAAVLLVGDEHPLAKESQFEVANYWSTFFPNTESVMGWDVVANGFKIILSKDVPNIALTKIPPEFKRAQEFLASRQERLNYIVAHPGGPKVIDSLEEITNMKESFIPSRESLKQFGNMSSSSVLFILKDYIENSRAVGAGIMMALGPAFCSEITIMNKC